MARRRTGATVAALLPAALAGAALVAAPFAGTTTSPLAKSSPRAQTQPAAAPGQPQMRLDVPAGSLAVMAGAEAVLVGVGAGVIVYFRRKRPQSA